MKMTKLSGAFSPAALGGVLLSISAFAIALPVPNPCNSTWVRSSAAQTCGPTNCQGSTNVVMGYDGQTNQCTFQASCCVPGGSCPGPNEGNCLNSTLRVDLGKNFYNCDGFLSAFECPQKE